MVMLLNSICIICIFHQHILDERTCLPPEYTAIGSPVSAVVTKLYIMEFFERIALNSVI